MLLLLESKTLFNDKLYQEVTEDTIKKYFRDNHDGKTFNPMFLVNDILRYWRTICLNYEIIRNDKSKPWRKKNINLKFSRILTIFGTILPIIAEESITKEKVYNLTKLNPLQRFAKGLDIINDPSLCDGFLQFIQVYEDFLTLKETMDGKQTIDSVSKAQIEDKATLFSDFIYRSLTHEKINPEYVKYLMV